MSTNINLQELKTFMVQDLKIERLTQRQAQKEGIKADDFKEANVDENEYLELDEMLKDPDLYKHYAALYIETKESEEAEDTAEEEENKPVQAKGGAGN